jgi:hypothetical protein
MADTDHTSQWLTHKLFCQSIKLSNCPPRFYLTIYEGRNPRAVIATILKTPQAIDQNFSNWTLAENTDNTAHRLDLPTMTHRERSHAEARELVWQAPESSKDMTECYGSLANKCRNTPSCIY